MPEEKILSIPWVEKRKEIEGVLGNEEVIAEAWELDEDLIFYYLILLATY